MNENRPTVLDIFAGIGGFTLAFESAGFRSIGQVEFNDTKRTVLDYWFPDIPKYGDIGQFDCAEFLRAHGRPDVIAGGPPCQAASLLGARLGTADERWMWPEAIRLARELRPSYCVFENPPAVLSLESGRAFNGVVSQMAALGYDCMWDVIPAAAFGAGHWRERLCIVFANTDNLNGRTRGKQGGKDRRETDHHHQQRIICADSDSQRRHETRGGIHQGEQGENQLWQQPSENRWPILSSDAGSERRQGQRQMDGPGDPAASGNRKVDSSQHDDSQAVPRSLPDMRGRVTREGWWYEVFGGIPVIPSKVPADVRIPVLVTGLPGKLVEAASLCIGDSIVPQAFVPIAKAIRERLMQARDFSAGKTIC